MKQNRVIGLTGGSGSGKSTVAAALKSCGAFVIDCDKIAHDNMLKGGIAYNGIVEEFGRDILSPDGEIDRKRLGGIVFNDSKALERLNGITHRLIAAVVNELVKATDTGVVVIDAPLLKQAGLDSLCDEVWVTDAPYEVRLARIVERDGITPQQAADRLKNQGDYDEADRRIITNFRTIEELESYIKEII